MYKAYLNKKFIQDPTVEESNVNEYKPRAGSQSVERFDCRASDSRPDEFAERHLLLDAPPPGAVVEPVARQLEAPRGPLVRLAHARAERLVDEAGGRERAGRVARRARRAAAQQPIEVLPEARAHAIQRYGIHAGVDVREHEAGDLERVPVRVVLVARVRVEVKPQHEDVRRQEADGEQHDERLTKKITITFKR